MVKPKRETIWNIAVWSMVDSYQFDLCLVQNLKYTSLHIWDTTMVLKNPMDTIQYPSLLLVNEVMLWLFGVPLLLENRTTPHRTAVAHRHTVNNTEVYFVLEGIAVALHQWTYVTKSITNTVGWKYRCCIYDLHESNYFYSFWSFSWTFRIKY